MARPARRRWTSGLAAMLAAGLCLLHGLAVWAGLGGREGLISPWPLARHDHPLYFHSALVTRSFLKQSGTTAGYDPSFMAGYAKSIIFPASSTLPELAVTLFGSSHPVRAYKLYVLLAVAAVPWLVRSAGRSLGPGDGFARLASISLFLVYLWTDFPIQYATYGMVPYLLGVPLALTALVVVCRGLDRNRGRSLLPASLACWAAVLVHFTTAMVLAPAVVAAYLTRLRLQPLLKARSHFGFWLIPIVVVLGNVFWWWPGVLLTATKGASGFAFAHPEGVGSRLLKILTTEPPIQAILWALGVPGLVLACRRQPTAGVGLTVFAAAGFGWGYAAGASRSLDFLQPGRHTFALYTALAVASGHTVADLLERLSARGQRVAWLVGIVLLVRASGAPLVESLALNLADPLPALTRLVSPELSRRLRAIHREPFLSSRPTPILRWLAARVPQAVRPGERLLYEEGGFSVPGLVEPFGEGRYSGLIPFFAPGVEVLGGPYLHAALTTNFTQFGEGRLFGKERWTRRDFEEYARIYRPSAIVCWSPHARSFCRENPDLVAIEEDDGRMLLGRIQGFGGATIEGRAEVRALPGELRVEPAGPGELDDLVVLRYHFVPRLRASPPVRLEPVRQGDDPVPFIGVHVPAGGVTLRLDVSPIER